MRLCAVLLAMTMFAQQTAAAQALRPNVISQAQLGEALLSVAERRAANLAKIRHVLEDPDVARAAARLADTARLSRTLAALDDKTLDRLVLHHDAAIARQQGGGKTRVLLIIVFVVVILAVIASSLAPESS